jgi:hypothetical protein
LVSYVDKIITGENSDTIRSCLDRAVKRGLPRGRPGHP